MGERREGIKGFSGLVFALLWLPLSLPLLMVFTLCFVPSGPRLHPRQKESRKPMKVSPYALGWDPSPCLEYGG